MNALRIAAAVSLLSLAACASETSSDTTTSAAAETAQPASISALHNTCRGVRAFVNAHGAALVYTSPDTYDRVVQSGMMCETDETTQPDYVRTSDDSNCFAGYTCVPSGKNGG
jgi:hypothetical protein